MAGEDIIIRALIQAGLTLDPASEQELGRHLSALGEAIGEGANASLRDVAKKLTSMRSGLTNDINLLSTAAKRGVKADQMSAAESRALRDAFNRVQTYYQQLNTFTSDLNKMANKTPLGPDGDKFVRPLFDQLNGLNTVFAKFRKVISSTAPLIDTITVSQKKNNELLAKERQKQRQDEARALRRRVMSVDDELRGVAQRRGRKAFFAGAQDDYASLTTEDARAARRFAQAEFAQRSKFKDLAIAEFGIDDERTRKAIQTAASVADKLDKLDERLIARKEIDRDEQKAQRDNRRLAKIERDMQVDREVRSRAQGVGRSALLASGGDVTRIQSAEQAGKALKFLNDDLNAQRGYLKALLDVYDEADPKVRNVAAGIRTMADQSQALETHLRSLQQAEADKRKADTKAEREQDQAKRKAETKAEQDRKAAARRSVKEIEAARALELAGIKDGFAGRDLFRTASKQGLGALTSVEDAQRALKYAEDEFKYRDKIEKLTREAYGAQSREAYDAERSLDRMANSYARLTEHVRKLKDESASDDRDRRYNEGMIGINAKREQRAEKDALGRAALMAAGGLDADVTKLTNVRTARAALDYLEKDLADLNRERELLTKAYGAGSGPELAAIERAKQYAVTIRALKAQIESLASADKRLGVNERIEAIQRKRATSRRADPDRYALTERALADPQSIKSAKELGAAIKTATGDLGRLQRIQDIMAKSANGMPEEYAQITREVNQLTDAIARATAEQRRLNGLVDEAETTTARSKQQRSAIYGRGRELFKSARKSDNFESLDRSDRAEAAAYARARRAEAVADFDRLSANYGVNSESAQRAAAAVREYDSALRRMSTTAAAAGNSLGYLSNVFKMFLKYAVIYQGMYAIASSFAALARSVADLQAELLEIQAVTGSSVQDIESLGASVSQVAANSKFSLLELTKAAKTLAQAGIPIAEINTALNATANFAAATGTNLETAADLISTTRDVFKELTDDVIANQLAKAINISKLTGEDLKTILSLGAQTARDFGLTSEQFLGAVAALRNAGLKASTVATGLRQGMLELFGPDNQLVKALQARYRELGEDLGAEFVRARFFAFTKSNNPLVAALTELKRLGFSDEGQSTLTRAFDVRSSNAIKAMIDNLDELSANEAKITFGRAAAEGAATVIDGLNASFTRLYSTITSFTYDSSKGFVAWLTDVTQKLDQAIQKQMELNSLRDATAGMTPEERQNSAFNDDIENVREQSWWAAAVDDYKRLTQAQDDILSFGRNASDPAEDADRRASGSAAALSRDQLRADEFTRAALAFDVERAKAGGAVGEMAQKLYDSSVQLRDLSASFDRLFGEGQDQASLKELIKSYTDLSPTQRGVRRGSLRTELAGSPVASFSDEEFDRSMFDLRTRISVVDGAFRGFVSGWNEKLIKANEVVRALGDRQPTSAADIEAVAYQALLSRNDEFLNLLRNTSAQATEANFQILLSGAQAMSDALTDAAGTTPFDAMAAKYGEAFVNRISKLANTTVRSKADGEINQAVAELGAKFDGLDQATLDRLRMIQSYVSRAAALAQPGAYQNMLQTAVSGIQGELDKRGASILKETAERVKFGTEAVRPGVQESGFIEYMSQVPKLTPGAEQVARVMANPAGFNFEEEFRNNTELARYLSGFYTDYRDTMAVTLKTREEILKEEKERLALEAAATDAMQDFNEANSSKEFSQALAALSRATAAEMAVAQKELEDARAEMKNFTNTDPGANRETAARVARAQRRVDEVMERDAKERARIERERVKYNLASRKTTAQRDREEALGILRNADGYTPQAVIDAATQKFDAATDELLAVLDAQRDANGEYTELQKAENDAQRQRLRHFNDTSDALDLAYRKELTIRNQLNDQLEALELTTGDRNTDARYRELGLEPGSRTQRRDYLRNRSGLLQQKISNAVEANRVDADRYAKNQVLIDNGKATSEIMEDQRKIDAEMTRRRAEVREWAIEIADLQLQANNAAQTLSGALDQGFDLDTLIIGLEQAGSSVEGLALKIHDNLVAGIEGIGDAFADALLEGEDFLESMDKLFLDTGKAILRDVIKAYTTESITGFLKFVSPTFRKEQQQPGAVQSPLGGGIGGLISSVGDWLTGKPAAAAPVAGQPAGEQKPSFGLGDALLKGDAAGAAACCCGDGGGLLGLGEKSDGAADAAKAVLGKDNPLQTVAQEEGKGFFDSLKSGFSGLLDMLTGGFGKALSGIASIFTGGAGGGGGGALGLLTALIPGFKNGGVIKAATGGIITGPGTGTSDSVPGLIRAKNGKLYPLLTSNGESILNARATKLLGEDGVHALNSGQFLRADTSAMVRDTAKLMRSTPAGGATGADSARERIVKESRRTDVHVTPAQMRMRLGDWLEQQVLEEMSKR